MSRSPHRRDGVSARTISDHFRLASSPRRRLGSYHFRSFQARLVAATAARLVPFPIISGSPRRRDGGSARTISDHFRLASSPRRRLGSYHFRSFQARLVAATAARLVPFPIISGSPRRRDGGSARTISDHFRLASSPRRRRGSYHFRSFQARLVAATAARLVPF